MPKSEEVHVPEPLRHQRAEPRGRKRPHRGCARHLYRSERYSTGDLKVETYCLAVPMFEFVRSEFGPEVELMHDVHERSRP